MSENVSDTAAGRQREERGCGWSPGSSREQQGKEEGSKGGASRSANHLYPPDCASSRRAAVTLTVGLQPEFKRQLEAKAKRLGISVSELIGRILRADIEHGTKYLCWIFAVFVTFCSVCSAESYTGTVTRVIDGDTIVMASDSSHKPSTINHQPFPKVRLADIDAPELRQPQGRESKRALESLVLNRSVAVHWTKRDRYRRLIGTLQINGTNINHLLVRRGHAWHYRRYSRKELLAELQAQAKSDRVGVWKNRDPIPPWEWRGKRGKGGRTSDSAKRKV